MPLWPFGRKKRRTSTSTSISTSATTTTEKGAGTGAGAGAAREPPAATAPVSDAPAQATARPPSRILDSIVNDSTPVSHDRRGSVRQDLTALPATAELDASPHLRPANVTRPVHPYNLDRPSSSRSARMAVSDARQDHLTPVHPHTQTGAPHKPSTLQKRPKDHALREEQIRQMSAPMPIPKRPAASANDLLRRDSKKARRTLGKHHDSTVSLPFQDSIHSAMSSEQRDWKIGAMSVLSPRPTVRVSGSGFPPQQVQPAKRPRNKEKLPELARSSSRKDRRKVADLADDLDSSELRVLMERDQRRTERKVQEQHERLDRKLRKRAEKQRAEEERREREARERAAAMPTAIHPAFRGQQLEGELVTPVLLKKESKPLSPKKEGKQPVQDMERGRSQKANTYLRYPARQDIPQNPFADPEPSNPFTAREAEYYSPVQTPIEDAVLETARAVRLSVGYISPPSSPVPKLSAPPEASDLQPERNTSVPPSPGPVAPTQRRPSESSTRRPGTWASIFRRGPSATRASGDSYERSSPSKLSFVNTSRESMSKQPIPAHLVQQPSSRLSGAPVRTQSKFREDLPELPTPPASRVQSPELGLISANVAAARRAKRAARHSDAVSSESPDMTSSALRTDSPVIFEDQASTVLSQSFASIDSEGSWMSGRPMKHSSVLSQRRSSLGSFAIPKDDLSTSFDQLPVPEHEYFASVTPEEGSRRPSGEQTVDVTPTAEHIDDGTPLKQATALRRPTVVHNDPRHKSREGLLTEYDASELVTPLREGSFSGDSTENSPVELQKAQSVNYGRSAGHVKSLSAGSARLLDISPGRKGSRTSPASSPKIIQGQDS